MGVSYSANHFLCTWAYHKTVQFQLRFYWRSWSLMKKTRQEISFSFRLAALGGAEPISAHWGGNGKPIPVASTNIGGVGYNLYAGNFLLSLSSSPYSSFPFPFLICCWLLFATDTVHWPSVPIAALHCFIFFPPSSLSLNHVAASCPTRLLFMNLVRYTPWKIVERPGSYLSKRGSGSRMTGRE